MYAMDGLFGLPRKKSTGVSHHGPLLGSMFFNDQFSVDEFVSGSVKSSSSSNVSYRYLDAVCHVILPSIKGMQ